MSVSVNLNHPTYLVTYEKPVRPTVGLCRAQRVSLLCNFCRGWNVGMFFRAQANRKYCCESVTLYVCLVLSAEVNTSAYCSR